MFALITPFLGFLGSPMGKVGGMVLIALFLYGAGYTKAAHVHDARCEATAVAAQLAAVQRDASIAQASLAQETADNAELAKSNTALEAQLKELRDANPDAGACALSDADRQRLLDIK